MQFRTSLRVIVALASLFIAARSFADSDFGVTKLGPSQSAADTDVAYTVQVFNAGPDDADVTLTDNIPAGMTFVSLNQTSGATMACTDPGFGNGGTITCTNASMTADTGADFTITLHIPSQASPGDTFTNIATVSTGGVDPNDENNASAASTSVPSNDADVGVQKTGPNVAPPGADVAYTITVTNGGPSDAQNVELDDTLPGTMTFVSLIQNSGPAFNCSGTSTITCTISTLPVGTAATFTLTGNIPGGTAAGTSFTNTATVKSDTDPFPDNNSSVAFLTVSNAELAVVKSGPASVTAGQTISYTITATNNGPDTAGNVNLTDILPSGTTLASFTQNTGPAFFCAAPPPGSSGTVQCTINTLASGVTATFSLALNVSTTFADGGTLTNTASFTSDSGDANPNNNSSSTSATVTGVTDLSVTKSAPATIDAGTNLSYTITVQNLGANAASSTQLSDTIPAGTAFVSFNQNSGPAFSCSGTTTISCSNASFPAGATATFTLVVSVPANATGSIANTATVSTTTGDTNSGNDSSTANTTITQHADLAVTKSGPSVAAVGSDIAYTISVSNAGPSDASAVTLSDTIPAQTSFVSMQQNNGPAFNCGGTTTVTCTIATLAPAASATFMLTVHVNSAAAITNTANISATTSDPVPGNNTSSAFTTAAAVDLSITKSVSAGPYVVGTPVTFTLTVTNNSAVGATNIVVTDPLPAGMSATATTPPGACSGTTTVTCTAPALAAGASTAFTITANLPPLPGNYTNTATVSSATTEATPADNTGSAGFAVVAAPAIPTLSPGILALLAALLGIVGIIAMKR